MAAPERLAASHTPHRRVPLRVARARRHLSATSHNFSDRHSRSIDDCGPGERESAAIARRDSGRRSVAPCVDTMNLNAEVEVALADTGTMPRAAYERCTLRRLLTDAPCSLRLRPGWRTPTRRVIRRLAIGSKPLRLNMHWSPALFGPSSMPGELTRSFETRTSTRSPGEWRIRSKPANSRLQPISVWCEHEPPLLNRGHQADTREKRCG